MPNENVVDSFRSFSIGFLTSTKLSFHDFMSLLERLITFSDVFQIYYEGQIYGALIFFSFITKVKNAKVQNWALIFHLPIISREAIDFVRILTRCHYHRGSYFGIQKSFSHKFLSNKPRIPVVW